MMGVEQSHKGSQLLLTGEQEKAPALQGPMSFWPIPLNQLLSQCKYPFPIPQR